MDAVRPLPGVFFGRCRVESADHREPKGSGMRDFLVFLRAWARLRVAGGSTCQRGNCSLFPSRKSTSLSNMRFRNLLTSLIFAR